LGNKGKPWPKKGKMKKKMSVPKPGEKKWVPKNEPTGKIPK